MKKIYPILIIPVILITVFLLINGAKPKYEWRETITEGECSFDDKKVFSGDVQISTKDGNCHIEEWVKIK